MPLCVCIHVYVCVCVYVCVYQVDSGLQRTADPAQDVSACVFERLVVLLNIVAVDMITRAGAPGLAPKRGSNDALALLLRAEVLTRTRHPAAGGSACCGCDHRHRSPAPAASTESSVGRVLSGRKRCTPACLAISCSASDGNGLDVQIRVPVRSALHVDEASGTLSATAPAW